MLKERKIHELCKSFLKESSPTETIPEIKKPYPASALHEMTSNDLSSKLYEARRLQHLIPQFSTKDIEHQQFVEEAVSILEYRRLNEISTARKQQYVADANKSVGELARQAQAASLAGDKDTVLSKAKKLKQRNDSAIRTMGKADIEVRKKWNSDFGKNETNEQIIANIESMFAKQK